MPLTISPDVAERRLIADALKRLREAKRPKVHQSQIAAALGITTQAWQKYEAGERNFSEEKIEIALGAIGATEFDFEAEKARIVGAPAPRAPTQRQDFVVDVYGRARAGPRGPEVYDVAEPIRRVDLRQFLGPNVGALEVVGESVSPWAESGEVVLFDRDRYPRRGMGCVIETTDGEAYVKFYEKTDGSTLFVRELVPEERTIEFPLSRVKGVYAVRMRVD